VIEFLATADWQSHHLMLFSAGGIRFDAHFVIWVAFLCFFYAWCKSESEKKVALILAFGQFLILFVGYLLDLFDFYLSGSSEFAGFIANLSFDQERIFGIGLDATVFAFADFATILALIYLCKNPARIIDPIITCLVVLIVIHLSVASISPETAGGRAAYDVLWLIMYYAVFIVLFFTSGRSVESFGYFRGFDYCHILLSSNPSRKVSKKC
jgi:hypothetical protein